MRVLLVSQMYPGPTAPELGVFVQGLERELEERGHVFARAVVDHPGGRGRHAVLLRDVVRTARRFKPDVVYAHFLVPAGLLGALAGRAPLVVTAHGQDVRERRLVSSGSRRHPPHHFSGKGGRRCLGLASRSARRRRSLQQPRRRP